MFTVSYAKDSMWILQNFEKIYNEFSDGTHYDVLYVAMMRSAYSSEVDSLESAYKNSSEIIFRCIGSLREWEYDKETGKWKELHV